MSREVRIGMDEQLDSYVETIGHEQHVELNGGTYTRVAVGAYYFAECGTIARCWDLIQRLMAAHGRGVEAGKLMAETLVTTCGHQQVELHFPLPREEYDRLWDEDIAATRRGTIAKLEAEVAKLRKQLETKDERLAWLEASMSMGARESAISAPAPIIDKPPLTP